MTDTGMGCILGPAVVSAVRVGAAAVPTVEAGVAAAVVAAAAAVLTRGMRQPPGLERLQSHLGGMGGSCSVCHFVSPPSPLEH